MNYKDRVSARIAEIGVKTKKIWLKQDYRGLFAKKQNFQGLFLKKLGARSEINIKYKVYIEKQRLKDGGYNF